MKTYIGAKIIQAEPQAKNYGDPASHGQPGYKVVYPDGYTSWSPAEAFEEAYRETSGMPFGLAVEAMKKGLRVARTGWNGAGMFAYLVPAASYPAQTGVAKEHFGDSAMVPYREYMALKTAQGDVATWAPSCSDALADDWVIVE